MITISVYKEPTSDDIDINECFGIDAEFTSNDESSTDDLLEMLIQAAQLDGYHKLSLVKSMKRYMENYLDNHDVPDWFYDGETE